MEWKFKQLSESDTKVDPKHLEFFRSEALDSTISALVREDIQNRLDANALSLSKQPLKLKYRLSTEEEALSGDNAAKWLRGLQPHLNAPESREELGYDVPFDLEQPLNYLAIEGFNTTGLRGDPLRTKDPSPDQERNDFFWFIRNVGRSGKKAGERGRWGLGKIVYPASSQIRSFICYSVREGDHRPALIGRSVLNIHTIGESEHVSEGYFAKFSVNKPDFAVPEEDLDAITSFTSDFNLTRASDQPGVSLVVPFPDKSISYNGLIENVIVSYFWEVLRGTMEVTITSGSKETTISKDTIFDVVATWAGLKENIRVTIQKRLEFCIKSDALSIKNDNYFELSLPRSYSDPKVGTLFKDEDTFEKAKSLYRNGDIIAFELPVKIKKVKGEESQDGSFLVFIQKDDELDKPDETFIRDGLTIISEKYIREAGVRALVLSEHEPLNEFLGDAENPAHTKWLTTTQHFKGKYSKGNSILSYVQRSALNLARALGVIEDEILENLLDDIFGIPTDEDTKSTEKTASNKPGGKKPPREGVKSRSQYITRSKLKDGFRVYNLSDAKKTPDRVVIRMAYEAEGIANPFTQYHPADFNLNSADKKLVVQLDGCTELKREPNRIEVSIDEPSFSVSIEGFDHKRDLKIDAKPYIDTEKEENEQ